MIWEMLLTATIETGLGLLTEVGFGDAARDLKDRLLKTDEKKRSKALEDAFTKASSAASDEIIEPLLDHQLFQEEVVKGLLNPFTSFDVQAISQLWGDEFSEHVVPLRRFFNTLQNTLLADDTWGDVLDRYQSLRFRQEVQKALQERDLPMSDAPVIRTISTKLEGSGAIAQGDEATAVGADGIYIGGNVNQLVKITIQQFMEINEIRTSGARQRYLAFVAAQANLLPWAQVTSQNADPGQGEDLHLADVYTNLDTTELQYMEHEEQLREYLDNQHQTRRIPAQKIVSRERFLLMMGDPGSGKSTFIKHMAYIFAQAYLSEDPEFWLAQLTDWEHGLFLPVRVELRHLAAFAEAHRDLRDAALLIGFIQKEFKDWGIDDFWHEFILELQNPSGKILFLLDGLDEVPTNQRQLVVNAVKGLRDLYSELQGKISQRVIDAAGNLQVQKEKYVFHRYIVTCRPYAYVGQPWRLTGFHEVTLAPFSKEQIDKFIDNWYEQLAERGRLESRIKAANKAHRLKEAVQRRDLIGLAERPLLLTVMAQLHTYTGQLPEDRTKLYADAVQLLLQRWEGRLEKELGLLDYLNIPGLKMSDLEEGLYKVAFSAHRGSTSLIGTVDIKESDLILWLKPYLGGSLDKAENFANYIRERAGLLVRHKTDAYTFPHRSFQEFLSACHWLTLADYPAEAYAMIDTDIDRWREVFILAAGYAARTNRLSHAIASVNALMPRSFGEVSAPRDTDFLHAILAGRALLEIGMVGVQRDRIGQIVLYRVKDWLARAIRRDELLVPKDRAEAGRVLSKLGDPRKEVVDVIAMTFCFIPPRRFFVARGVNQKSLSSYWISKYPVTNAQFDQFVDAGGYSQSEYWKEAIESGYWKNGTFRAGSAGPRDRPADYGEPYTLANHPVVGISFFEALAFARWVDTYFHAEAGQMLAKVKSGFAKTFWNEILSNKLHVNLPTHLELDNAACDVDRRLYPWGNWEDPNCANYDGSGIDTTSTVGCFPSGRNRRGAEEMVGNVFEWVIGDQNLYGSCFSSGCFSSDETNMFNNRLSPIKWNNNVGFRLVASA